MQLKYAALVLGVLGERPSFRPIFPPFVGMHQTYFSSRREERTIQDGTLCGTTRYHSGYLPSNSGSEFFFMFFEAANATFDTPVSLWINGGPGTSSLLGAFNGVGPCSIDGQDLAENQFSWTHDTHLIVLDQPTGTGFSYSGPKVDTSAKAALEVYCFLLGFFEKFPRYRNRNFHMFSESYGGHYLPNIGKLIMDQKPPQIQLRSIAIGNGLLNPRIQFRAYFKMACQIEEKLFSLPECKQLKDALIPAYQALDDCYEKPDTNTCRDAWKLLDDVIMVPYVNSGRDIYDIRRNSTVSDEYKLTAEKTESFFNQGSIQSKLGIRHTRFTVDSETVYAPFYKSGDLMESSMPHIEQLLNQGIRVLLYAGDADFICNWIGLQDVAEKLNWKGSEKFRGQRFRYWFDSVTNEVGWRLRSFQNFSFVRFLRASHMAHMSRPREAQYLIHLWLKDQLLMESVRR